MNSTQTPTTPPPSSSKPKVQNPVDNSAGSFDTFFKESGANGGGTDAGMSAGGGTNYNPANKGALKAHGD